MSQSRKPPVNKAEVEMAIQELLDEGLPASVRNVHRRVGRGSLTTLSRIMKEISVGIHTPELHLEQFPTRLEILCREMVAALNELAIERVSEEREKVEKARRNIESRWDHLMLEKETAIRDLEAERRSTESLREELHSVKLKLDTAVGDLLESKERTATAEAQVGHLTERLTESSRQVEKLEDYVRASDISTKQQRQHDQDEFAAKLNAFQSQLQTSRSIEMNLNSQLAEANREKDNLASDLKAEVRRAEQAEANALKNSELVVALSVEQNETKKREERREQKLTEAQAAKDTLQTMVTDLQGQLIEVQSRIEEIRTDSASANRSVITSLVEHAGRALRLANAGTKKSSEELQELVKSQADIEKMFGG